MNDLPHEWTEYESRFMHAVLFPSHVLMLRRVRAGNGILWSTLDLGEGSTSLYRLLTYQPLEAAYRSCTLILCRQASLWDTAHRHAIDKNPSVLHPNAPEKAASGGGSIPQEPY
jgi:hypothetical protein